MRHCEQCGYNLVGRTDKKFCNDYCRNSFNNKRYRKELFEKKKIEGVLTSNYNILKSICTSNKVAEASIYDLSSRGFEMKYFTNLSLNGEGEVLRQCFDMGLLTKQNGKLFVVNLSSEFKNNYQS